MIFTAQRARSCCADSIHGETCCGIIVTVAIGVVDPCFNVSDDVADVAEAFNTEGRSLRFFMFIRIR
jgi:hypothetical protein